VGRTVTTVPDALCDAVTLCDAVALRVSVPPALDVATLVAVPATRAAEKSREITSANIERTIKPPAMIISWRWLSVHNHTPRLL
jgi:hypothetical protein